MRKVSHRAVVVGGPLIGKMVFMDTATHSYSPYTPGASQWPRRGVVIDGPDDLGLQEILICGSINPDELFLMFGRNKWIVATGSGGLATKDTLTVLDEVCGYTDSDGIGWIGKPGTDGLPIDLTQWERKSLTLQVTPGGGSVIWDTAPGTTDYHVLIQPTSTAKPMLELGNPSYQADASHSPYLPISFTKTTSSVSISNSNASHPGIITTYDVQLVR